MASEAGKGETVAVSLPSAFFEEVAHRAAEGGISVSELLTDLFATAYRLDAKRPYPVFKVPDEVVDLLRDGIRVVKRESGRTTMCAYGGVSFDAAIAAFHRSGLTEDEIVQVVRSA